MKKLILMAAMVMVVLIGCGNKPEPITEAEVTGHWVDEKDNVYTIHEGGMVTIGAPMKLGEMVVGMMDMPVGTIAYGDEVKITWSLEEDYVSVCVFSEDRNTITMEVDGETATMTRISKEEAAAMGVDVE